MNTRSIAKRLAEESMVLLKNESNTLPFSKGQRLAFFGRTQLDTIYSGNGSGAANVSGVPSILSACEARGLWAEPELKAYYQQRIMDEDKSAPSDIDWTRAAELVHSGVIYELFGQYHAPKEEPELSEEQLKTARAFTDTAVLILGRSSGGEECDRHLYNDYYLTDSEQALVRQVCESFSRVVLILNINGLIDLEWTKNYPSIKSIMFMGVPGEEGAAALAELLTGAVTPSGKLAVTIAERYEDYPASPHFSYDKKDTDGLLTYESYGLSAEENGSTGFSKSPVTVYLEDIFVGYRYFDSFNVKPLYPFGFGLSYTEFNIRAEAARKTETGVEMEVSIRNCGAAAGKETVQLYLSTANRAARRPAQELKAFAKTGLLHPGDTETVLLSVPWQELAAYDEKDAAWKIERGTYRFSIGNSSRSTRPVLDVVSDETLVTQQCVNRLGLRSCNMGKLDFLVPPQYVMEEVGRLWTLTVSAADIRQKGLRPVPASPEISALVQSLSLEELAALCVGYGPGTAFSAFGDGSDPETIFYADGTPVTTNSHPTGHNGYVSPAMEKKKIRSIFYKDGPAGVGALAWPTEMLIACAFDVNLWYEFGNAVGKECEEQKVDVWLAPAVNLHRHPLNGRNFEYFSEDPLLTGLCACAVTKGVQENHPVWVCPKHFAVNEQETWRRGSGKRNYDAVDSILTERAARELYLKPFQYLVQETDISFLMTSFNKINGTFASGNHDLCTHILREEWGFCGVVVTDWGDMDTVVDGADAVAAGNDIVMPGGPPVIEQILKGHRDGRVSRNELERAVERLLYIICPSSFVNSAQP